MKMPQWWIDEVNDIASQEGYNGDIVTDIGREYWQEKFDEGKSPSDAYDEMMDYA